MQGRIILFQLALLAILFPFIRHSFATERGLTVKTVDGFVDFYQDYQAIVIGVSDYQYWPKIPNAVKDAREVSNKLLSMGYEVKLVINPNASEMRFILTRIAWKKGKEKNRALLIYFAGHGETVDLADGTKLGYIIPKDGPLYDVDPFAFDTKAISMKDIEMLALKIQSRHVLMLFDSCFSGSIFGLTRAAPSEINKKSVNPVRQFITSGDAYEKVPDQSVFKVCFLQALDGYADYNKDGYLTGSELGKYLQSNVIKYTRGSQHPQYGKINNPLLDKGDFVFKIAPKETSRFPTIQKGFEDHTDLNVLTKDSDAYSNIDEQSRIQTIPDSNTNDKTDNIAIEYKIAIFPWKIKNYPYDMIISKIAEYVQNLPDYKITESYYNLSKRGYHGVKETKELKKHSFWMKKTFFGSMEPDIEMVQQVGQGLGVDAVILGATSVTPWPEKAKYFKMYLINIKTGKYCSYNAKSQLYINNGEFKEKLSTALYEIFKDYREKKYDTKNDTAKK